MSIDSLTKANKLYSNKQFKEALSLYLNLAEEGNYGCARRLGWMYALGEGVEKDFDDSLKWLTQAAKQGDSEAKFAIGWLYLSQKEKR